MSPTRKIAFSALALLLLALGAELLTRAVLYQLRSGQYSLALVDGFTQLQEAVTSAQRDALVEAARDDAKIYLTAQIELDQPIGEELRAELRTRYEREFVLLQDAVRRVGSEFVVLDFLDGRQTSFGAFIQELAARYGARHYDLSSSIRGLPEEFVRLRPADGHLTRAANLLMVRQLAESLTVLAEHRSGRDYSGKPAILGDVFRQWGMAGGRNRLMAIHPQLGFRLIANRQGLRNVADISIPKRRQRILALGDSFTFGPHLNNQDTWPALLEWQHPDVEVLNAGVSGYTITDQRELFVQRAQYAAPDITILQVCNNDLLGLTAFLGNRFARTGAGSLQPSPAETRFIAAVRAADKAAGADKDR